MTSPPPLPIVYMTNVSCFPREIEVYHTKTKPTDDDPEIHTVVPTTDLSGETEISHTTEEALCTTDISCVPDEQQHKTDDDKKKTKRKMPELIKLTKPLNGSSQYYTYSLERQVYLVAKQPSSANSAQTDHRCVVSGFRDFESDDETKEIFWTLFGTIVGFESIPALCVENINNRKMVFVSFTSEKHCNVIIDTFNDCPFMRVEKKKRHRCYAFYVFFLSVCMQ